MRVLGYVELAVGLFLIVAGGVLLAVLGAAMVYDAGVGAGRRRGFLRGRQVGAEDAVRQVAAW